MTVGIVGAGLTGLTLTHHLRKAGVDVVTFEADDEPGGVIRSREIDGLVVEHGPQRMRLSPTIEPLVDELDLRDEMIAADDDLPLFVYANGRLREAPFDLPAFLRTDLLSWRGKARVFAEPLTADANGEERVADLFARKFGTEAYQNLIGPLFGGTFGSDPREMRVKHSLSGVLRMESRHDNLLKPVLKRALKTSSSPAISFEKGLQTLPRALYEENEAAVELETPVEDIRSAGDGYVLDTASGEHEVDRVVITTPADAAGTLLADVAPDATERLERLNYNPLALVYLRAEARRLGFGYQIRHDEGFDTLGVSWNGSMFDRGGLHTCFLGGMKNPDLVDASDEELGRIATEEFEAAMGFPAEVLSIRRLPRGFPAYDRSWDALDGLELPDGVHLATNYTARMGMPSRIREAEGLAGTLTAGE